MYYSEELIEEVRERNDIVDVISSYVKLQKRGSTYFGLCPFHNEKTPSFSVTPSKQMYYCFGCGAGGNVITFIMEYENLSFPEALKLLADRVGIVLPEVEPSAEEKKQRDLKTTLLEINKLAANYFYYQLTKPQGEAGLKYLKDRQLSDETIKHFGLGWANKTPDDLYKFLKSKGYSDSILKESGLVTVEEKGSRDKFWNRVIYPILDVNSRVIAFGGRVLGDGMPKYLNSPETKLFDKSRNLYGLNFARTARKDYLLVCEGYMDVISLHQAGFTNAVASLGTALTSSHALLLKRYTERVVLTYDSDEAGIKAALRAIPLLKGAGISAKVINMKPYKDPDEFIKALGKEEYEKCISEAKNSFLWEIEILKRRYDLNDPEQKTEFYKEIAIRLCEFREVLERENYMKAVCKEQDISYDDMRRMVNSFGERIPKKTEADSEVKPIRRSGLKNKEDGVLKSQRLMLTYLIEDESLFEKTQKYIGPDDFTEELYHEIAVRVYHDHAEGILNPATILSDYLTDEDKQKKVASLFNSPLSDEISEADRHKAIEDCIRIIKKHSLEEAYNKSTDIHEVQRIVKEQAAWTQTKIAF